MLSPTGSGFQEGAAVVTKRHRYVKNVLLAEASKLRNTRLTTGGLVLRSLPPRKKIIHEVN